MARRLKNLQLTRVDRVDKGSNPGSKIVLFKSNAEPTRRDVAKATFDDLMNQATVAVRAGVNDLSYVEHVTEDNVAIYRNYDGVRMGIALSRSGDTFETDGDPYAVMLDFRPVTKSDASASGEGASTVTINKEGLTAEQLASVDEIEKELADAVAKAAASDAKIAELEKAAAETGEPGEEVDVLKGLSDSARVIVEKAQSDAAEAQAMVAKMQDEADTAKYVGIAKSELAATGDAATELGSVLKSIVKSHGSDSTEYQTVLRTLKAAAAQSEDALDVLSKNLGSSGEGRSAGPAELKNLAKAYAQEHGVTGIEAMRAIRKANPDLHAEYNEERAAAQKGA